MLNNAKVIATSSPENKIISAVVAEANISSGVLRYRIKVVSMRVFQYEYKNKSAKNRPFNTKIIPKEYAL